MGNPKIRSAEYWKQYYRNYWLEHREEYTDRAMKKRKENWAQWKAYKQNHQLKQLYGITLDQYREMVIKQEGKCALCGEIPAPSKKTNLHVDHDHKTNKIRQLICNRCNRWLAPLERKEWMEKANDYLKRNGPL